MFVPLVMILQSFISYVQTISVNGFALKFHCELSFKKENVIWNEFLVKIVVAYFIVELNVHHNM